MIISKQLDGGTSAPTLQLEVTYDNYDISNNRTKVNYVFSILRPSNVSSEVNKSYTLNIGDNVVNGTTIVGGVGTKEIKTGSYYIDHNEDGTKSINISFSINIALTWSGTYNGIISKSGVLSLPTIPRATTPTLSSTSVNIGGAITISTPRVVSTFKHNLYLVIGSTQTSIATNVATSYSWTIPNNIATQITKAKYITCKIVCDTLDGSTTIGSKSVSLTINVPNTSTFKPTINKVTISDAIGLNGYVESKTQLSVVVSANGVYNATIKSITSTLNNVVYKGTSFTTETLNFHTTKSLVVKVVDSRGYATSQSIDITPMQYEAPTIATFEVQRCNAQGVVSDTGTYIKVDYNFNISSLESQNTKSVVFAYATNSTYTTLKTITDSYSGSGSFISDKEFSTLTSFTIRMGVQDKFTTNYAYRDLPTEKVVIDLRPNGKGLAFGKVAETDDIIEMGLDVKYKNDTEWAYLTLDSNFVAYNGTQDNTPKYKVRDKIVEIRGIVSPTTEYTSDTTYVTIATLPSEVCPSDNIFQICQGSGINKWLLKIATNGVISISRYGTTAFASVPTNAWLVFNVIYLL